MRKRLLSPVIAACLLLSVASLASANVFLADWFGYDYTAPNPWDFTGPGQWYDANGVITSANPIYLTLDPVNNEYTFRIYSGMLTSADTLAGWGVYQYAGGDGTIGIYEDSKTTGTLFDYGVWPPNGTAPSTFIDGTLMIGGSFATLMIRVNLGTGDGSLSGTIDWTGGTELGNFPADQHDGWTFAGFGAGMPGTPLGYIWQIDGEIYLPETATEESSWGNVKNLFR
jgi:hypothetical protein